MRIAGGLFLLLFLLESLVWLAERRRTPDQALVSLSRGEADAVIHDEPLLRWTISHWHAGELATLPLILERQDYAIALRERSPLREDLNRAILERIASPRWAGQFGR